MQFQEKEFLPVILGADITAYSLARSFHEEYGIKSLVLSMSEGGYIANSDIIENRIFPGLENKDVLVKHLIEVGKEFEGKKKLIVLGCGDWYVRALIESKKELSPYYIIPYIDVDLLNKIVLKDKFYEIFEELGLNYPKTYVYECGKENDLKFDFDYPVIAKPANSAMYHYAKFDGKKKVFRFNNEEELRDMLAKLEKSSLIKFSPSFRQSSGVSPYSFRVRDISITPIILPCIIISAILSGLLSNAVFICIPDQTPNCASGPFSLGNLFSFASRFTASPDKSV